MVLQTAFGCLSMISPQRRFVILTLLTLSIMAGTSYGLTPMSDWVDGIATNYGGPADGMSPYDYSWGTKEGACGYGMLSKQNWPYWSVGALSTGNRFAVAGPSKGCGQCFEIVCVDSAPFQGRCSLGPNQVSVIVQITDECPECAADHLDLQALTYGKLAPMETGRINIQYRRVECVPPADLQVVVDNNSGPGGWLRLFVEDAGGPAAISSVQVKGAGTLWMDMTNKWGSAWEIGAAPPLPLDLHIVGVSGNDVTAFGIISSAGAIGTFPTGVQFRIATPGDTALVRPLSGVVETASIPTLTSAVPAPTVQAATSTTPSTPATPSASPSAASTSAGGCSCSDVPPSPNYTCAQQNEWGKCNDGWMVDGATADNPGGFCQISCGRCTCG